MADAVTFETVPDGYEPPDWDQVSRILEQLKRQRQPVISRIWETKRARRGNWEELLRKLPAAYRKMLPYDIIDLPQIRDMLNRVSGMISRNPPVWEVTPASSRPPEVSKAAKEEARLAAVRLAVEDQQDRPTFEMGIDAQCAWGESWIGVFPDPSRLESKELDRKENEPGEEYRERYSKLAAGYGIPLRFEDFDPQTVYPYTGANERIPLVIVETENTALDIELGLGFKAVRNPEGKATAWTKRTISQGYVPGNAGADAGGVSADTDHDTGPRTSGGGQGAEKVVKRTIYADCWTVQTWLDGVLVEEWRHNHGAVPIFPAYAEMTSDRDPAWASSGIADASLSVAKMIVLWSAILASNAMQHGFPTPFLKNPQHGLVHPMTGEPLVRSVQLGELNLLAAQEDIIFPFLQAQMMPDFFKHMDWLTQQMESSTISNFGKAVGTDIAGYAVAQIRAMQMSILATIYSGAARQWRKIGYYIRHLIKTEFPAGIYLRGAVEEADDGTQFRPVMAYASEHCTDYAINVHIDEGIQQDEIAERKSNLEMAQAGAWSLRRVMENTRVEDPDAEKDEIAMDRLMNSPAADQQILTLALALAAERFQATDQQKSSPFMQALADAKKQWLGGQGQFQNQGALPANADTSGKPLNQTPQLPAPQQGGPAAGPGPQDDLGIPGMPGGVKDVNQVPAGAPA